MTIRPLCHALLSAFVLMTSAEALHAAEDEALDGREAVTTAKERLVNKAADPQRVNDCKVPEAKRDVGSDRSGDCPHLRGKDESDDSRSDG